MVARDCGRRSFEQLRQLRVDYYYLNRYYCRQDTHDWSQINLFYIFNCLLISLRRTCAERSPLSVAYRLRRYRLRFLQQQERPFPRDIFRGKTRMSRQYLLSHDRRFKSTREIGVSGDVYRDVLYISYASRERRNRGTTTVVRRVSYIHLLVIASIVGVLGFSFMKETIQTAG